MSADLRQGGHVQQVKEEDLLDIGLLGPLRGWIFFKDSFLPVFGQGFQQAFHVLSVVLDDGLGRFLLGLVRAPQHLGGFACARVGFVDGGSVQRLVPGMVQNLMQFFQKSFLYRLLPYGLASFLRPLFNGFGEPFYDNNDDMEESSPARDVSYPG